MKKMEDHIRKFFWKGGKANEKKIPLLSWIKISMPRLEGRLNFKNISMQNLALGEKLIWRIIAPKLGWAQIALWKKFFRGQRKRCLDHPKATTGSPIQKLCAKSFSLINDHAHWMLGSHPNPLVYVMGSRHRQESIKPILIFVSG